MGGGVRHFRGQGQFRVIGEAQQFCQLAPQFEGFLNDVRIVPLAGVGSLIGRPRGIGPIDLLPERRVLTVGQHGIERRKLQGDQAAFQSGLLRGLPRIGQCGGGKPGELFLADLLAPGVGGIQYVVAEAAAQFRQAFAQPRVLLFLPRGQCHSRQAKVPQHVIDRLLPGAVQGSEFIALGKLAVGLIQAAVLAAPGAVLRQQRQAGVVGGAQFFAVGDAVQVGYRRPGLGQLVVHLLDGLPQVIPAVAVVFSQNRLGRVLVALDQLSDSGFYISAADARKRWQRVLLQQGVRHDGAIPR